MADTINIGKNAMDVRKAVKCLPYSKVIINVEQVDTDTVVSYEAGDDTGITLEFDCPWGTQAMANSLLQKVKGYQYQPYTVTSAIVSPAVEMGDAVQANGVYGGIYQQDTQFGHTMYSDFSAPEDEQLDHEYTFETPVERRLTRQEAYTKANFQIQHDNIEARVTKSGGYKDAGSFSWRLEYNEFGLFSGTKQVFKCTKDGITVDGEIKARSGYIGSDAQGFVISDKCIYNGMTKYNDTAHNGVYIGTDGIGCGSANFYVTSAGKLVAQSGDIGSGTFPWKIGDNSIYYGKSSLDSSAEGIYLGTDGIAVGKGGSYIDSEGYTVEYTAGFYVSDTGDIEANTGTFRGTIITEAGSSLNGMYIESGTVDTDQIAEYAITESELSDYAVTEDKLEDEAVSEGKLGSDSVSEGKIQDSAVSKGKTSSTVQGNLDAGQGASDWLEDVNKGRESFNRLSCSYFWVDHSDGGVWQAAWKKTGVKDKDGNTVYLNYLGSSTTNS